MSIQAVIEQKLANEYDTDYLRVENESHMHNVAPGSESHFKVTIVSNSFRDQMLIKRHRMVNKTLQQELQQIHALALHHPDTGRVAVACQCRRGIPELQGRR